jgi:tricorn protease
LKPFKTGPLVLPEYPKIFPETSVPHSRCVLSQLQRASLRFVIFLAATVLALTTPARAIGDKHLLQHPAMSGDHIVFVYAGDLWSVDRNGGEASRLTTGVGVETAPAFSPDGSTIAFTGEYDGNVDVFTMPAIGGVPHRVTYHPAADTVVGWSADGKQVLFRSTRLASSRYTQIFEVPPGGGWPKALPLPYAYQGQYSPDGKYFAYSPLPLAFGFEYSNFVSWGHYRGGRASTVWIANMSDLSRTEVPHELESDFYPVWMGGKVYFLSGRRGTISLFSYDPATKKVEECVAAMSDIHSLSAGPNGLIYDQLGEIYIYDPATGKAHQVPIQINADLPEVRAHIADVHGDIENAAISPTGVRAVFEAHGDILTVPAKKGPTRDLTSTPGAMEREPAWSPDGQSVAFFSDESGLYELHIASQTGEGAVKKFPLEKEADYYFNPQWSPDSKQIVFSDKRDNIWLVDIASGKLTHVGENDVYGEEGRDIAWSPDSKWLAYSRQMENRLHVLYLYSIATGQSAAFTDSMADSRFPTFDRDGKYLFFTASTNEGGVAFGLDMTSDILQSNRSVYALVLANDQASPLAPESDDEKAPGAKKDGDDEPKPADDAAKGDEKQAGKSGDQDKAADKEKAAEKPVKPIRVDLAGLQERIVALPLSARSYVALEAGKKRTLYFLERGGGGRFEGGSGLTLSRYKFEDRKTEKLADHLTSFDLSANGEKMLISKGEGEGEEESGGSGQFFIVPADAPVKPGDGVLNLSEMRVKVDPPKEWNQMYHEVWRIERSYFYDPHYHGVDTVAEEKRFEPYVQSIASRTDLNYIFAEMLGGFSVGHLRGGGGTIPSAHKVPGGLLGADYEIRNGRYCITKIYTGGEWNPRVKAPLAQPGLKVKTGDCILAVAGEELSGSDNIQRLLEGTAGQAIVLHVASSPAGADAHDITVIPTASEAELRNIDWIEGNRHKVDQLSGGKLAYVYLPDTGAGGFTNFNRYYMAQTQKSGAVIDERFNAGGQVADYIIEAMKRQLISWWSPRYGAIERTPSASILGPKVMIANEYSGSGGDALPWMFKQAKLGPLVGKRTWGGLVGIGGTPSLMDGGAVTSPGFAFFNPEGQWDVENHGVQPDYEVEMDPKAVAEGHDPQLEKAVALALQELSEHPVPEPHRPAYPNYHSSK